MEIFHQFISSLLEWVCLGFRQSATPTSSKPEDQSVSGSGSNGNASNNPYQILTTSCSAISTSALLDLYSSSSISEPEDQSVSGSGDKSTGTAAKNPHKNRTTCSAISTPAVLDHYSEDQSVSGSGNISTGTPTDNPRQNLTTCSAVSTSASLDHFSSSSISQPEDKSVSGSGENSTDTAGDNIHQKLTTCSAVSTSIVLDHYLEDQSVSGSGDNSNGSAFDDPHQNLTTCCSAISTSAVLDHCSSSSISHPEDQSVSGSVENSTGIPADSPHQNLTKYEVFINHRGPDVKLNFVAHLAHSLREKKIKTFVDQYELVKGEHAFKSIERAIQAAQVHLAIFSHGYADSKYCLDELCDMLECTKKNASVLLPVFYDVEPADLRRPDSVQGPFTQAFRKHKERGLCIEKWKEALKAAADIDGFTLREVARDEDKLKEIIIGRVQQIVGTRLHRMQLVPQHRVGLQRPRDMALQELEKMGEGLGFLGIVGMGGLGKTTLAKEIYNFYSERHAFESQTFLKMDGVKDVANLQKQALRDLLQEEEENVVERYNSMFKSLVRRTVLIVIDGVLSRALFQELVPDLRNLGQRSRIILTSRDKHVLTLIMRDKRFYLHKMRKLSDVDSYDLFRFHAIPKFVKDGLVKKIVNLCEGLPLALEIIGEHLYGKEEDVWIETANSQYLSSLDVLDRLSISYRGLPSDSDRMMFLDVSCQMIGLLEEDALDIWQSCIDCRDSACLTSKHVKDSLSTLKAKSLVEVDKDKRLTMHDLLREMGRKMVGRVRIRDKRLRLGEHSHLWDFRDAQPVLIDKKGTNEVRGLSMVGIEPKNMVSFDASSFQNMTEIHLLQLDGAQVEGDFSQFPEKIRWLQWRFSIFTSMPSRTRFPFLIMLDLSNSDCLTQLWSDVDTQVPKLLRVLTLQNCISLEKIPESIKYLTKLRILDIQGCKKLNELPDSICELNGLQEFNISGCANLYYLPVCMNKLLSLKTLLMNHCIKISKLPEDFGSLGSLALLSAEGACNLSCLPDSFSGLSNLEQLVLDNCNLISELPKSIKGLAKLKVLQMSNTTLKRLPKDFGHLDELVELNLQNSNLKRLPKSFGKLSHLKFLNLSKCLRFRKLSSNFGNLSNLEDLNIEECPIGDDDIPLTFGDLKNLKSLRMKKNNMKTLPDYFMGLTTLLYLNMQGNKDLDNIQALPASLEELDLGDCPKLMDTLVFEKLTSLRKLNLCNCRSLVAIQGLEFLKVLEEINVSGCRKLREIHGSLLLNTTMERCFLSGSRVSMKYNKTWSQDAPSSQVVSYYDPTLGFVENRMAHKITSKEDANELCMETIISSEEIVEALIVILVAHDQGPLDYPQPRGRYNSACEIEARIIRSNEEVYTSRLFYLRYADKHNQVYLCTLRKSHPLVKGLQKADKICIFARSRYRGFAITVKQGTICLVHKEVDLNISKTFEELYLKDRVSNPPSKKRGVKMSKSVSMSRSTPQAF